MAGGLAACQAPKLAEPAPPAPPPPPVVAVPTPPPVIPVEPPPPPPPPARTEIAVLTPAGGRNARVGEALRNAAQLAYFDHGGDRLKLIFQDSGETPATARKAVAQALEQGAELIIGPFSSAAVRAAGDAARSHDVPVLGFSSDTAIAGAGVWLMGFPPQEQVDRVARFAAANGSTRFAAIVQRGTYGERTVSALNAALAELGLPAARVLTHDPSSPATPAAIRELLGLPPLPDATPAPPLPAEALAGQAAASPELPPQPLAPPMDPVEPADAVLVPDGGAVLARIASLLMEARVDPATIRILGTDQWNSESVPAIAVLEGGWFAGPPDADWNAFRDRYRQTFGSEPMRIAAQAYDALSLAATLDRQQVEADAARPADPFADPFTDPFAQPYPPVTAGTDTGTGVWNTPTPPARPQVFTVERLTDPSGFAGIDGIFRFRADGVAQHGLAVYQVIPSGFEVIDPAPEAFADTLAY